MLEQSILEFIELIPMMVIFSDQQQKIYHANQKAKDYFSIASENFGRKNINEFFPDNFAKKSNEIAKGLPFQIEISNDILSIHPINYKNYCLILIKNVTHLDHIDNAKDNFIANISHELRTPLTVFQGYLELLLEQQEFDHDTVRHMLNEMHNQSIRMEQLVMDLLLLFRLEHTPIYSEQYQDIDVSALIRCICSEAKILSGQRNHLFDLNLNDNLLLRGNLQELRSAFTNIIFNAVHYTPDHGKINMSWFSDNQYKIFRVNDNGIGIAPDCLDKITQRFYRVDPSREQKNGLGAGLGLSIVQHVLKRHCAELRIESELNRGSTFDCLFPLSQ